MTHLSTPLYRLLRWVKIQRKSGSNFLDNQQLDELKVGMKVYVDELYGIEGVYIVLGNPRSVLTADGNRVEGIIKKISKKKLHVNQPGETLYFRRKGYADLYEN